MDEYLTTGQMIDTLQVGETAVSDDEFGDINVIKNELGYYYTFRNDKKRAWRLLSMDTKTVNTKWKILK